MRSNLIRLQSRKAMKTRSSQRPYNITKASDRGKKGGASGRPQQKRGKDDPLFLITNAHYLGGGLGTQETFKRETV